MKKEAKKELFLDRYCKRQFAVIVENGKLTEFAIEEEPRTDIVGNIYKGKVTNVLPGMNAAFINCGLSKNCYLSFDESYTDYSKYDGTMSALNPSDPPLQVGDEIIVQVTKPPRDNKGAKVSTHLSFVGRRIIYLPNTAFLGISRKITDEETRDALLKQAEKLRRTEDEGFIIRTQAPFATAKQIKTEALYLKKLYEETMQAAKNTPVGTLLYEDEDLPVRMIRDSFGEDISAIHVGDEALYKRMLKLLRLRGDFPERKLIFHNGERSMFSEHGLSKLLYDAASPTVPLDNGAYIVIDHTEAMTVIDVNTGSFVGENSLEETVFAVNLAAAKEIATQVRLRNIGGIIVVDFIDMQNEEHKIAVTEELKACLALDKAKCNVLPMSELCLTQFTRKRVGLDVLSFTVKGCPYCKSNGHVHNDIFVLTKIRSKILDCFANGFKAAIVEINEGIMRKILNEGIFSHEAKNRWKDKRVYFVPHRTFKEEYFTVRGDNADVLDLPNKAQLLY